MKGVNIFLADGFEDVEALGTADVLRRGGISVKLVAANDDPVVVSSHHVAVGVDAMLSDLLAEDTETAGAQDVMIFPGGMPGTKNLAANESLMQAMIKHYQQGGVVAAICAAPGLVASQLPGMEGKHFTCFDGFESYMQDKGAKFQPKPAVKDGNLITGRSAGHALTFGLEILRHLTDEENVAKTAHSLYLETE